MEFPKPSWNDPDVAGEVVEAAPVAVEGSETPPDDLEEVRNLTADLARAVEAEGQLTPENRERAQEEATMFRQEAERTNGIFGRIAGSKLRAFAMYGLLGLSAMAITVGGKPEQAEGSHQKAAASGDVNWGRILERGAGDIAKIYREQQQQASRERIEQMRRAAELERAKQHAEIARLKAENALEIAKMKNEQQLRSEETKLNMALIRAKSDKERAEINSRLATIRSAIASKQTKAVEVTMEGGTGAARVGVGQEAKGIGERPAPQPERPIPQAQEGAKTTPPPPAEEAGI